MTEPQRVLGLFAKWPAPGTTKTRLTLANPQTGAQIARAFLLDTMARLVRVHAQRVLVFAPDGAHDDFATVAGDQFSLESQGPGDLGQRLARFINRQLERGAAVVVVGADSPTLPIDYIARAYAALASADVVIGPAADGGYYLLGCAWKLPPVFEDIAWGTDQVFEQTVSRLKAPEWRVTILPPWYDVDTPEDWTSLYEHVAAIRRANLDPGIPRTEALLSAVGPKIDQPLDIERP
jgi:uncharacterized protein